MEGGGWGWYSDGDITLVLLKILRDHFIGQLRFEASIAAALSVTYRIWELTRTRTNALLAAFAAFYSSVHRRRPAGTRPGGDRAHVTANFSPVHDATPRSWKISLVHPAS